MVKRNTHLSETRREQQGGFDEKLVGEDWGRAGQFDRIYINDTTGEVIFVEAKGGGSRLGVRTIANGQVAQQGTREYMDDIIDNMREKLNVDNTVHPVMRAVQRAIDEMKINYILVRQGFDDKSNFIIKNFPI